MVLVFYFLGATMGAAAYAGSLAVDPVSDNSIRFHERTRFSHSYQKSLFIFLLADRGFALRKGRMSKPANPVSGALWIRRQTGRLSGWIYGSDNIMVL
jgi:hypothetical protein